ncbi:helix-turn-helix domain-containing protein [Gordonia sp. L191]|uniref:helix-turn-helix domain-containing protein n=1 Tax=Gordonia sp. L191 TaxID=2982699 RepID=UPI0024C0735E|nr:helix-turn-helix domain-containing protein [Gordonia sp. L191]WHU48670.1 helix-turn-helix domain-containing protein [Gordonia sp. L191]
MDSADVAEFLGVTTQTVRRLITEKGLPAYRITHRFRFVRAEVEQWARVRMANAGVDPYRAAVRRLVDEAPQITPAQADRIRAVLTGGQ